MNTVNDNILLTVPQIVELFEVSAGAVRAWIAAGLIQPVRREGRGRGGQMLFARGEVVRLVFVRCPVCGDSFKCSTLRQKFCSQKCRQRSARIKSREGESHA